MIAPTANKKWVSVWGNAMSVTERTAATYGRDITFRYPVPVAFDGDGVRLTFDNFCGTRDVFLTCAYVARAVGDEQMRGFTACPVTFGGEQGVSVPAGGSVVSDPVSLSVRRGELLSVFILRIMSSSVRALCSRAPFPAATILSGIAFWTNTCPSKGPEIPMSVIF